MLDCSGCNWRHPETCRACHLEQEGKLKGETLEGVVFAEGEVRKVNIDLYYSVQDMLSLPLCKVDKPSLLDSWS
jgi:hypothetical protein